MKVRLNKLKKKLLTLLTRCSLAGEHGLDSGLCMPVSGVTLTDITYEVPRGYS